MAHKNRDNWSPYTARKNQTSGVRSPGTVKSPFSKAAIPGIAASKGPFSEDGTEAPIAVPRISASRKRRPASAKRQGSGKHKKPQESFTFEEADDRIASVFRCHGFADVPHAQRRQLTHFYQLLMDNQKNENFTRLLSLRDVAIKHFIDSLMVARLTQLTFPLLDMGTGPGFPGIPLKVLFPKQRIILAEGVQKRVNFLKNVREEMQLRNLDIIGRNINESFLYPVQGVITRAVEDARNTLGNVLYSLQTGGRVFLMKGPNVDPEIPMALDTWGEWFELEKDIAYELPQTPHQRRLLVFRKTKPAPLRDLDADLDIELRQAGDDNDNKAHTNA